jgi:hypothetical protein
MTHNRSMFSRYLKTGAAVLAVATLGMTGAARADNLTWSLGLSSPGVVVGVSNAQPVYVQPQRVYVQPQPVYVQPQVVYRQQPQVVYVQPAPQVVYPGWRHHGHRGHGWENRSQAYPTQYVQPVQYAPQVVVPAPVHGYGHNWR